MIEIADLMVRIQAATDEPVVIRFDRGMKFGSWSAEAGKRVAWAHSLNDALLHLATMGLMPGEQS